MWGRTSRETPPSASPCTPACRGYIREEPRARTACQKMGCASRRGGGFGCIHMRRRSACWRGNAGEKIGATARQGEKSVVKRLAVGLGGVSQTIAVNARQRNATHLAVSARNQARPAFRRQSFDSTRRVPRPGGSLAGVPISVRSPWGTQHAHVLRFGRRHRGGLRRGSQCARKALAREHPRAKAGGVEPGREGLSHGK